MSAAQDVKRLLPLTVIAQRVVHRRRLCQALLGIGVVLGTALRLAFLHRPGVDLGQDVGWAHAVAARGLLAAYNGDYFPLQWAVFGGAYRLAQDLGLTFAEVEKLITVAFDLGNLALIAVLLRRWRLSPAWALLYWLQPYSMVIDWNGYADPQMMFFVLAALVALGDESQLRNGVLAGALFAGAMLMKAQAIVLAAMLFAYSVVRALLHRNWDAQSRAALLLLVPTAVALVGWSIAFALAGRGVTLLAHTYLSPPRANIAISVYMPNVWYPIRALYSLRLHTAFILRTPRFLYGIAVVANASLLLWVVVTVARRSSSWQWSKTVLVLFASGAAIQPMVFFGAHENHFFLAAVLCLLLCLLVRSLAGVICLAASLLLQTANLLGGFGVGGQPLAAPEPIRWLVQYPHRGRSFENSLSSARNAASSAARTGS